MKRLLVFFSVMVLCFGTAGISNATIIELGGGLVYDDVLKITWLQDANYAQTTGSDDLLYGSNTDGTMRWDDAVTWAEDLVYQGHKDWRLPLTPVVCYGPNPCTTSEMGYLYWTEGISSGSPSPFINVRPGAYWSGSTLSGTPLVFPLF